MDNTVVREIRGAKINPKSSFKNYGAQNTREGAQITRANFCGMETETAQHTICSCEALSLQRYNVFGKPLVEPKEISTASVRDLCLFIRVTGLLDLC
jgi:hypothetical protein